MRSLHHNTMSDVTAQKSHYVSFVARERCDTERSINGIFMRRVREWAACRWASSLRSRRKSFFKHLTGAESILPCLRVISTRPLFCTGVITLHFTQPVIPWHAVTVFEQRAAPWSERLSVMFSCMAEYTESQRIKCMSSHWAPFQCWHKARWFTPVVSGTKQFSSWPALWIKWHSLGSIYSVSFWLRIQHRILPMLSITKTTSHQVMGQSIYSEGLSMLMKDKAKGQDCWIHGI